MALVTRPLGACLPWERGALPHPLTNWGSMDLRNQDHPLRLSVLLITSATACVTDGGGRPLSPPSREHQFPLVHLSAALAQVTVTSGERPPSTAGPSART